MKIRTLLAGSLALLLFSTVYSEELSITTLPASVVKTMPQSGVREVDAESTKEIRVTFSKDMTDKSWSWSEVSEETFPKIVGTPRYLEDKRTCVVDVELEPNRTYAVWINSPKFGNFKDVDGHSSVPYLLVFKTK